MWRKEKKKWIKKGAWKGRKDKVMERRERCEKDLTNTGRQYDTKLIKSFLIILLMGLSFCMLLTCVSLMVDE